MYLREFLIVLCIFGLLPGCASSSGKDTTRRYERASEYYSKALYSDAERELLALTRDMPNDYDLYFRLGNIYVRTGQLQAAERMYQKCIDLDPNQPKGWYNLSLLRVKQALYLVQEGATRSADQDPAFAGRFATLKNGLMTTLNEQ